MRLMLCRLDDRSAVAESGIDRCDPSNGGQVNVMAADWIVIPLARSAGRKSVTVLPSSTSAAD